MRFRWIFRRYLSLNTNSNRNERGWKKYLHLLKERPTSHLTAFAILHELTAILPFPLIYYPLKWSRLGEYLPIPMEYIQEGNRRINKVRRRYGFEELDSSSLVLVNLSMTYAIVKILLPLRIGLSLLLTPWLASLITRSLNIFQQFQKRFLTKTKTK